MSLSDVMQAYFRGERHAGFGVAGFGVLVIVAALWLWRTDKSTFGMWLLGALGVLGLLCTVGGAVLAFKTPGQVADLMARLDVDRDAMVSAEIARMAKVNANWPRLELLWAAFALLAIVLVLWVDREWASALGLSGMLISTTGFFLDVFAQRRALVYADALHARQHEQHGHPSRRGHHHLEGGMPHRFERAEEWVERFEGQERLAWQKPDEVVAALGLGEDATVADIGAGTGYFSIRLARAVPNGRVFAVDVEADMVRYLTERVSQERLENVTVLTGQPDNPALPEPVDVAFVCNVYHHIDDRESYFAQVRRSLAPGGRLVVVDFKKDAPADSPGPPAEHRLREADVERELAGAGFTLTASDRDLLPFHYMLTFTPTDRSEG